MVSSDSVGLLPGPSLVSMGLVVVVAGRLLAPIGVIHLDLASGVLALGCGCRGAGCQRLMVMVKVWSPLSSWSWYVSGV